MNQQPDFNLDALLVFARVVEYQSLSRAAISLGMPKSTVSRKISKLERDLGAKLLRRNTHQLSVTDLGERIYQHCLSIQSGTSEICSLLEESKREPQGALRVALPAFVGIDYASRLGAAFLKRYPKSQLDLRMVDKQVDPVRDGYDVVFGIGPLDNSSLVAHKVFSLDCFLCASTAFIKNLSKPLAVPSQLNNLPFIDFDYFGRPRKPVLSKGNRRYELAPAIRARVNNFQISKHYILSGLGVGIMPKQIICAGELVEGTVRPILPKWDLESIDVYMLYPFRPTSSNLISAFYDIAREIITENTERGLKTAVNTGA